MKSFWRKIAFISMWVILILGTVGAIVAAATMGSSNGGYGFYVFVQTFLPALFFFIILAVYLEHTNNIEMRVDQQYRKDNGMPQLPESAYTNLPTSNGSMPYGQPMPPYQPSVQMYKQPAPAPVQQPAPAPAPVQQPAPAPAPVQQAAPAPAPVQQAAPAPAPVQQAAPEAQPWTCPNCGVTNNPTANFCKGCGSKKA